MGLRFFDVSFTLDDLTASEIQKFSTKPNDLQMKLYRAPWRKELSLLGWRVNPENLHVEHVEGSGPVHHWNQVHHDKQLCPGYRITSVNGIADREQILNACISTS